MLKNNYRLFHEMRIHVLVWFCFITYEVVILGVSMQRFENVGNYFLYYSINIFLFYFHSHVVLSNILKRGRIALFILPLAIGVEIAGYIIVLYFFEMFASKFPNIFGVHDVSLSWTHVLKSIWRSLYFIGFSTGYYFLITFIKERERTVELERQGLKQIIRQQETEQELAKAQNAYLRAQINPHFLFNTLNFIYNRSRKTAPIAADAILTLSAMMRYAIESGNEGGDILIEDEIEQVNHLVHLHKLRQNEQIYFNIVLNEKVKKIRLVPLVLITLVENIFKHGNLSLSHHPALLEVIIKEDTLCIFTDNLVNAIHNASGFSKGLENIGRRLNHAYGEAASFHYETDSRNHFKAQVSIKLGVLSVPDF